MRCWLWHKWGRWYISHADIGIFGKVPVRVRYCTRCGKSDLRFPVAP